MILARTVVPEMGDEVIELKGRELLVLVAVAQVFQEDISLKLEGFPVASIQALAPAAQPVVVAVEESGLGLAARVQRCNRRPKVRVR